MSSDEINDKDHSNEDNSEHINHNIPKVFDPAICKNIDISINTSLIEAATKTLSVSIDTSVMKGVVRNISINIDTSAIEEALKNLSLTVDTSAVEELVKNLCASINTSAIAEEIKNSYASINSAVLSEAIKNLDESINTYLEKTHPQVRKYNWFFTPSMDLDLWRYIYNHIDQQTDSESFLKDTFVNYFSSNNFYNLEYMVDAWNHNSLLSDRSHIFKECVSILKDSTLETSNIKNPHCIVIPALIAQIDGLISTFLLENGLSPKSKDREDRFGESVTDLLTNNYGTDMSLAKFLLKECTTAKDILLDVLFQHAVFTDNMSNLKPPFSRHKIMHGQVLDYGNIENTIRLFLIIDFLASLRD